MIEKKIIQINHALSGVHGKQLQAASQRVTDARKQILKRLQRKKKLASVIQDELYWYLQRYPQQKQGLHQQSTKKKKNKVTQDHEQISKLTYQCPVIEIVKDQSLLRDQNKKAKIQSKFNKWFTNRIDIDMMDEEKTQ